jgi:hypothetical protein
MKRPPILARKAFPAHGEKQTAAASGRRRRFAFTAAVEKN